MNNGLWTSENRNSPSVTIIIPTKNESEDIAETIEACLRIDYEPKEILIVDDSSDDTPEIVRQYADRGVRMIHRAENRNGCCGARNEGMKNARGELVTFFNADDRPYPDFLRRMIPHFAAGADYVVAQSKVRNLDNRWARYIRAGEIAAAGRFADFEWSEGFTCRQSAARAVGYIPGDFPVLFCRDWMLGDTLRQAGFRKRTDAEIIVEHISPDNCRSFWHNQVWRSGMWAPSAYFMGGKSLGLVLVRELAKNGYRGLQMMTVVPFLCRAVRDARLLNGASTVMEMLSVRYLQALAYMVGSVKGVARLAQFKFSI